MNVLQFQKNLLGMQENMMNFALTLTTNRNEARDLLQDTMLRVLRSRHKYVDNINFRGWVLTIMRNIFINNYHRLVHTQTLIDSNIDLQSDNVVSTFKTETPEDSYRIVEIYQAIENLDENIKEPFNLYLMGYKYREISDMLHLPIGTVKSRIFCSRRKLKKTLLEK